MEMQVDGRLIRTERERRAWSQSHLANVAGLGLRTVQRIEATGGASYESASAIASVFSMAVSDLVPVGAESRQARPSRRLIWLASAAGIVMAAALIVFSLRTPGSLEPASSPALSQLEPIPPAATNVPAVTCPAATVRGRRQLNLIIECESTDPEWAPVAERQLRSLALGYFSDQPAISERFHLERVRCRTTICELQFFDAMPTGVVYDTTQVTPDVYLTRQLWTLGGELHVEPWRSQFDLWESRMIGSLVDGEWRLYLQRSTSAVARL